ncbi:MAG: hypothetical protein K2O35_01200, partial [Clostridia bacterium]|nr:hypothetical protein [Clostridia bacterium]
MLKSNRRIFTLTVCALMLLMILSCLGAVFMQINTVDAFILSDGKVPSSQANNLDEMLLETYLNSGEGKIFNKDIFWRLITQISGISNPSMSTLDTLGATASTAQNFRDLSINDGKDITVEIGGKKWTATYLSRSNATPERPDGDPILTLWLATTEDSTIKTSRWSAFASDGNGDFPASMYGTSEMRAKTLNNGGTYATSLTELVSANQEAGSEWAIYTMTQEQGVKGSIKDCLASPTDMEWQHNQRAKGNITNGGYLGEYNFNNSNDALDNVIGSDCVSASTVYEGKDGYTDWANDKLWIPSIAETGMYGVEGIWVLSNNQRANSFSDSNCVWTRSANPWYYNCVYPTNVGAFPSTFVTNNYAVRPAFHLNLRLAAERTGTLPLAEPIDVTSEYNGQEQTLANITDTSKTSWYDSSIMTLEYTQGGMKDADTYQVKAKITTEDEVFIGEPDASKGESADNKERVFNFTITKKKIGVKLTLDTSGLPTVSLNSQGDIYSGDTEDNGRAPNFGFHYVSTDGNGYNSDELPTAVGAYRATVKILNECNYQLDKTYSIDFVKGKDKVNKPSIATREKPYTGDNITFNMAQYSDKVTVRITQPDGKPAQHEDGVITVKYAGTYTVTISLADNGVSTCWNTSTSDDIASYTIEIKVTPKKLSTDITCSDADFSWEAGEQPTMTITDERISGDSIDYYVYYLKSGESNKYDEIDSTKEIVGDSVIVTMPNDLGIGSYTFVVELRSNSTSSDNGNYYIDGDSKTRSFTVVGNGITVTENDIKWKVNNVDIGELTDGKLLLTYNGSAFGFSVDESNLRALGVKIDTSKGARGLEGDIERTVVGSSYKVTVWLCNYDNTYDTYSASFTLSYEIRQGKYDMSKVKWDYTDGDLKYNTNYQTVLLTGLPSTLSVIADGYEGNRQKNAGEGYVASVLGFDNTDSNYVTPMYDRQDTYEGDFAWTLTWSIGKATLNLEWESVDTQDGAGNAFKLPRVKGENAQFIDANKYRYYKSNGVSVGDEISLGDITVGESAVRYWIEAVLTDNASVNYEISEATKKTSFRVGSDGEKITVELESSSYTYDGKAHGEELRVTEGTMRLERINKTYYRGSVSEDNKLEGAPTDAGDYIIVLSLNEEDEVDYALTKTHIEFSIAKAKITAVWDTSGQIPEIANLSESQKGVIGYIYYDADGNQLEDGAQLEVGKTYSVKAILKGD